LTHELALLTSIRGQEKWLTTDWPDESPAKGPTKELVDAGLTKESRPRRTPA
jgi:hypothetical protein